MTSSQKVKLEEPIILPGDPFANCKLGRKECGLKLKNMVSVLRNGCVLAISGDWGIGKTTFVRMWQQMLEDDKYKTIYFNAWENDFISDPIIPIAGELYTQFKMDTINEKGFAFLSNVFKITKDVSVGLLQHITKEKCGEEVLNALKDGTEILSSSMLDVIHSYEVQKQSIVDLRTTLTSIANPEVVEGSEEDKPLIFIIDELDRCKPSYAVKVLERIKHIFNVPNIVYVLSIDRKQLANAVRGYYGSDLIDGEEYLKRFIDIEFRLPKPKDINDFCHFLSEHFGFDKMFKGNNEHGQFNDFIKATALLLENNGLSIRQIEKVMSNAYYALKSYGRSNNCYANIIIYLTYLRNHKSEIYDKIKDRIYNIERLVEAINEITPSGLKIVRKYDTEASIQFYNFFSLLLVAYCSTTSSDNYYTLIKDGELNFNTYDFDKEKLKTWITHYSDNRSKPTIESLISHIEFAGNIN